MLAARITRAANAAALAFASTLALSSLASCDEAVVTAPPAHDARFASPTFAMRATSCSATEPASGVVHFGFVDSNDPWHFAAVEQSLIDRHHGRLHVVDLSSGPPVPLDIDSESCAEWDVAVTEGRYVAGSRSRRRYYPAWLVAVAVDCPLPSGGRIAVRAAWDGCE